MALSVISVTWCLKVSCEKISQVPTQLRAMKISAGASQLAAHGTLLLTCSNTSPGTARTFSSRLGSDIAGGLGGDGCGSKTCGGSSITLIKVAFGPTGHAMRMSNYRALVQQPQQLKTIEQSKCCATTRSEGSLKTPVFHWNEYACRAPDLRVTSTPRPLPSGTITKPLRPDWPGTAASFCPLALARTKSPAGTRNAQS